MWQWFQALPAQEQLKAIALLGATLAFLIGLFQYRKAQTWKRSEWLAQEMESFFNDPVVVAALRMIDYGERRIELYPKREAEATRFVLLRDDDVAKALEHHSIRHQEDRGFNDDEASIRDAFDHLLARLERIQSFVQAGLLKYQDVRPYLNYWATHVISARANDPKVDRIVQLRRFIDSYGYDGVQVLFAKIAKLDWPADQTSGKPQSRPDGKITTKPYAAG